MYNFGVRFKGLGFGVGLGLMVEFVECWVSGLMFWAWESRFRDQEF